MLHFKKRNIIFTSLTAAVSSLATLAFAVHVYNLSQYKNIYHQAKMSPIVYSYESVTSKHKHYTVIVIYAIYVQIC